MTRERSMRKLIAVAVLVAIGLLLIVQFGPPIAFG
jgi:hypothetical protein